MHEHQTAHVDKPDHVETALRVIMAVIATVLIFGSVAFAVIVAVSIVGASMVGMSHVVGVLFAILGVLVGMSVAVLGGVGR